MNLRKLGLVGASAGLMALALTMAILPSAGPGSGQHQAAASIAQASTTGRAFLLSATGCNFDTCMYLSTPKDGYVTIRAYADADPFYGHFHIFGPDGISYVSPTKTWEPYGANDFAQADIPAIVGKWCVQGKSGTASEGTACENIL